MRAAIGTLKPVIGVRAACEALDYSRASFYRKEGTELSPAAAAVRHVPRALVLAEREAVLACLHEERFQNSSPAAVYATLLDEGHYHCSIRTMYRILEGEGEVRERRDQLVHPAYAKPELLATGPGQLWSWDITKAVGPGKVDILLPLRDSRCIQQICGGLDGRRWRKRGTGQTAYRGYV